ncbi:MAG TPA: NCS2 family permease [Blastocatellia bacterium]|nr:NCS2 family permease [Blastocatellia bacterium]HMV82042.1 NCS2 family permease [Blastocatellia bacterium]HMX24044.1 NCS2 family permease [Blastocatellia bacterium]HMY71820.1 NCS2 family permease [Blastocatellia bacterium]HMZ16929.1 NCS2 family permease [Blastocatellia bacterium]
MTLLLERLFKLSENNTTIRTEVAAGVTTFLTMAYIIFVNPSILSEAGVPFSGALFATCIGAAVGSLMMGLVANYPFALAPGMGLNAYFTYSVVKTMGYDWRVALGAIFLSGVVFLILTLARIRAMIVDAIPMTMKTAVAAGIGLFIAFIGLKNAGVIAASPATFVTLGHIVSKPVLLSLGGLLVTAVLMARGFKSAIIIGIFAVTAAAMAFGLAKLPASFVQLPDWRSTFLQLDIRGALKLGLFDVVFVFLFVDLFDTIGSLMGLGRQAGYLTADGKMPRVNRALFADAVATIVGSLFGTSTVVTYIESATGVSEGGRTGLTAVVVAALFLLAVFFSPIAGAIPPIATAPALILTGALMISAVKTIDWEDLTEAVPAFLTILAMPLTFSIANGLAIGFIFYPLLKVLTGRAREASPLVYVLAALFVLRYVYLSAE